MNLYDCEVEDVKGNKRKLADYKGKVVERFAPTKTADVIEKEVMKLL